MRNLKTLLLAVAITCSSVAMANTKPATYDPSSISKEVTKLLDKHNLTLPVEAVAQVTFTVNKENEIVVLEVDTQSETVENYIKSRLNYKKLSSETVHGKEYYLPVKIEKS
tara:strand:- start:7062 stop:7394 length:333 start_codon:yes stop_codon:yes gene_type:complete